MRTATFYLDTTAWSAVSIGRVYKYMSKGFECVVPGLKRELFGHIASYATKRVHSRDVRAPLVRAHSA